MQPLRRARLSLEPLGPRDCPSLSVTLFGGSLLVGGTPAGALRVTEPGPGQLTVTDNGHPLGTFAVTRDLFLALNSHPNAVTVDLGGHAFAGNVLVSLGAGDPAGHPVAVQDGTVGGNVTFLGGSGVEAEGVGSLMLPPAPLAVRGTVQAVGNASRGGPAGPGNTLLLGPGSSVGGDVTTVRIDGVTVGLLGQALPATVAGNLNVNDAGSGTALTVNLLGNVGKGVSVTGTAFEDLFVLRPASPGVGGNVAGDLSVNLGPGGPTGDSFQLGPGSTVGGNALLATLGTPAVRPPGGFLVDSTFQGSLTVNLGADTNVLAFEPAASVAGNLTVTGGGGDDTVVVVGTVGGNLSFGLGNGNDSVTAFSAPGGQLRWAGGDGNDVLTLAPPAAGTAWNVNVLFGSGADSFTLAGAGGFVSGSVNGGGGSNVFTQGAGWTIVSPWTLRNF